MNDDLSKKLDVLKQMYIVKLKCIINEFWELFDNENIDASDLYLKIHSISGTSGMYGLTEIGDVSSEFELYLKSLNNDINFSNDEEFRNKFSAYIKTLNDILDGD